MSEAGVEGPGLRDVSRWLTTPAQCGVYFSMRDLEQIGRTVGITGLPRNRRFAVEQLFRSAAVDGVVEDMLISLEHAVSVHISSYRSCDSPALENWIARAKETELRLESMRHESAG
jgi:hypothetical protein